MLSLQHRKSKFVLIQPVDEHDIAVLDNEAIQIEKSGKRFILSTFRVRNWNSELTAWIAPQAFGVTALVIKQEKLCNISQKI